MFWEDWTKKPFETNSAKSRPRLAASWKLNDFFSKENWSTFPKTQKNTFFSSFWKFLSNNKLWVASWTKFAKRSDFIGILFEKKLVIFQKARIFDFFEESRAKNFLKRISERKATFSRFEKFIGFFQKKLIGFPKKKHFLMFLRICKQNYPLRQKF